MQRIYMFEEITGVVKSRKSKKEETMDWPKKKKNYKRKTMIYKKLNRKQKVEQHKSHKKSGVNSGAPDE